MRGQTNASNIGGNVGDDTHPVKSVDGALVPVSDALVKQNAVQIYPTFSNKINTASTSGIVFVDNKTVTWDVYMPVVADIGNREIIASVPAGYFPTTDIPVVFFDVANNRLISGGVGYGVSGLFSDSLIAAGTQLRISFSYKIA